MVAPDRSRSDEPDGFPSAPTPELFYALGKPNDFVANDSLGKNFWLAFPTMANNGLAVLSLYISKFRGCHWHWFIIRSIQRPDAHCERQR